MEEGERFDSIICFGKWPIYHWTVWLELFSSSFLFLSMAEAGVRVPMEQVKMSAISDERVDFLREQAFTILRLKTDKWNRFIGLEENQRALLDFFDQGWREYLILFVGPGGTLHAGDEQVSISNILIYTHLQCRD